MFTPNSPSSHQDLAELRGVVPPGLAKLLGRPRGRVVFTRGGKAASVLLSAAEFRRLAADLDLADSVRGVRASMRQHARGKGIPMDEVFDALDARLARPSRRR